MSDKGLISRIISKQLVGAKESKRLIGSVVSKAFESVSQIVDKIKIQSATDSSRFADAIQLILTKLFSDSSSFSDQTSKSIGKTSTDQADISDEFSRTVAYSREYSDSFEMTDDVDGVSVADDDQYFTFFKNVSEAYRLGDATAITTTWSRQFNDQLLVIDSSTRTATSVSPDTAGFGDAITLDTTWARAFSDSSLMGDSVGFAGGKSLSDTGSFADSLSSTVVWDRQFNDSIQVTDDSDGVAISDDDQTFQFFKNRTDSATIADSSVLSFTKSSSDTISSSDSGLLLNQGYSDGVDYFAEDYVGQASSF